MNQQAVQDLDARNERGRVVSATTLALASLCGVIFWFALVGFLRPHLRFPDPPDAVFCMFALPPAASILPLCWGLLRARRWLAACTCLALYPVAVFVQYLFIDLAGSLWKAVAGTGMEESGQVTAGIVGACLWLWAGLHPYPALAPGQLKRRVHMGFSFLDLLLTLLLLGMLYSSMGVVDDYSPRARVSELILAGSSAKTALSEGMQTYGSWSADWMSGITISATGLVSSASISPTGVIKVWGTAPTSGSVVTMIPTATTDNKLVWSCTGSPARYMPASCR